MSQGKDSTLLLRLEEITEDGKEGSWVVPVELFASEDNPLPVTSPATLSGWVYKVGADVHFKGTVNAHFRLECSRCLKGFDVQVDSEVDVSYLPMEDVNPEGEELKLSADDLDAQFYEADEVDLFPPVRDQLVLATPVRPLCSEECRGLCPHCGVDLNKEKCDCETEDIDPRFAVLKKLTNKDNKQE